jgi:hypothetical protein
MRRCADGPRARQDLHDKHCAAAVPAHEGGPLAALFDRGNGSRYVHGGRHVQQFARKCQLALARAVGSSYEK